MAPIRFASLPRLTPPRSSTCPRVHLKRHSLARLPVFSPSVFALKLSSKRAVLRVPFICSGPLILCSLPKSTKSSLSLTLYPLTAAWSPPRVATPLPLPKADLLNVSRQSAIDLWPAQTSSVHFPQRSKHLQGTKPLPLCLLSPPSLAAPPFLAETFGPHQPRSFQASPAPPPRPK